MTIDQVVFFVGGTGSRLGTLAADTPKPVLPVGGRPFLDYLLDEASRYGCARSVKGSSRSRRTSCRDSPRKGGCKGA
jgi:molybdopterin-guanine dinucleotide biosynthesis protein A